MKIVKAGWEEKKKTIEKRKIEWEWTDHIGLKWDGEYEGEVKGGVPHGLGKWKEDGKNRTVDILLLHCLLLLLPSCLDYFHFPLEVEWE